MENKAFKIIFLNVGIILFIASCSNSGQKVSIFDNIPFDTVKVEFAKGFSIKKHGDVTLLTVSDPWQGAQNVVYHYLLCPKDKELPPEFSQYAVIRTPVERVVCLSTTHVAMLSALGLTESIKALSETAFVFDSTVRKAIDEGQIVDIGYAQGLNFERIISLSPDLIFAYDVDGGFNSILTRLESLGQKVIINAEYLERTALGKAEWIKFMAAFFNQEELATEKFNAIKDEYLTLSNLAISRERKPKILCDLPWQGIWHVPGGDTWMAAIIADAGGEYIWKNNSSRESIPISIEAIIHQGDSADIWINAGAARSLAEIRAVDARLSLIKPFQIASVYSYNARINADGGNDFFESSVVNPHIILKDMIKIFHPDLLPEHRLFYYMPLALPNYP